MKKTIGLGISVMGLAMVTLGLAGCQSQPKESFEEALQKEIDRSLAAGELEYVTESDVATNTSAESTDSFAEEKLLAYDLEGKEVPIDGNNVVEDKEQNEVYYLLDGLYPTGEYVLVADGEGDAYYCVTMEPNSNIIVKNGSTDTYRVFDTLDGKYLTYTRGKVYPIDKAPKVQQTEDGTYPPGRYKIGVQIPAGEYVARGDYPSATILRDLIDDSDSTFSYWNSKQSVIFKVEDGQYLEVNDYNIYPIDKTADLKPADGVYQEGMYKVGFHMPPGKYKLKAIGDTAYVEIYNDNKEGFREELVQAEPEATFTVKNGQYIIIIDGEAVIQ